MSSARLLALFGLLAVFVGSSSLFALTWMPIWLAPFAATLKRTAILGFILALLPLTYGLGGNERHGRLSRLYLRPLPWLSLLLGAPALTLLAAAFQVSQIERNPNLTLAQYLREDLWLVWILMLPAAALWLAGHQLWVRARRAT